METTKNSPISRLLMRIKHNVKEYISKSPLLQEFIEALKKDFLGDPKEIENYMELVKEFDQCKDRKQSASLLTTISKKGSKGRKIMKELETALEKKCKFFGFGFYVESIKTLIHSESTKGMSLSSIPIGLISDTKTAFDLLFKVLKLVRENHKLITLAMNLFRKSVSKLLNEGKIHEANRVFGVMFSIDLFSLVDESTVKQAQVILEILIKANLQRGNSRYAVEILSTINYFGEKPQDVFFNKILDFLSKSDVKSKFSENLLGIMIKSNIKASLVTFNTLLDLYISQRNFHMAWHLFNSLKDNKDPYPDNFTYSIMINGIKLMPEPQISKAFELYELYKKNNCTDLIIVNSLLDVCVSLGAYSEIDQLMEEIGNDPNITCDEITYNTLIKACSKKKNLMKALKYFSQMKQSGVKPNKITYNSLMDICVKTRNLNQAMRYLEEMKQLGLSPDEYSYSIILNGVKYSSCNKGVYLNIIKRLESLISNKSIKPDEIFFNSMIDVATKYFDINKAVEIFGRMKIAGIHPSTITYGILIKAYGKCKNIRKALEIFEELKNSGQKINVVTYGCLLDACVKTNRMDIAENLFQDLLKSKTNLNTIIFTTMIKGYSRQGLYKKARDIFNKMESEPEIQANLISYNCIIDVSVRSKDMEIAINYYNDLKEKFKPDLITFSTLIKGYCYRKNIAEAIKLLEEMIKLQVQPDQPLFNLIIDSASDPQNYHEGFKVYSIMRRVGIIPNQITYGTLIKIYGFGRKVNEAFQLLDQMKIDGVSPSLIIFTNLMHISFRNDKPDRADHAFGIMISHGITGDHICYSKLVSGFHRAKLFKKACAYVKKAFEAGSYVRKKVMIRLRGALGNKRSKKYKKEVQMINDYLQIVKDENVMALKEIRPSNYKGKNYDRNFKQFRDKRTGKKHVRPTRQAPRNVIPVNRDEQNSSQNILKENYHSFNQNNKKTEIQNANKKIRLNVKTEPFEDPRFITKKPKNEFGGVLAPRKNTNNHSYHKKNFKKRNSRENNDENLGEMFYGVKPKRGRTFGNNSNQENNRPYYR